MSKLNVYIDDAANHVGESIRSIVRAALMATADMTSKERLEFISAWCNTYCRKCGRERSDYKCACWDDVEKW